MSSKVLSKLFNHYGSDKDKNGYTPLYHTLFFKIKDEPVKLLEIGIGTMIPGVKSSMVGYALENYKPGGSLRAWRDYFVNGEIIGMDVQPDTQFQDEERIQTHLCDSTDICSVYMKMSEIITKESKDTNLNISGTSYYDIIIDDGCHLDTSQLKTLQNFYPFLKKGGIYVIEDIYPGSSVSRNPSQIKSIVGDDPFYFVGLHNNQCVIYKNTD